MNNNEGFGEIVHLSMNNLDINYYLSDDFQYVSYWSSEGKVIVSFNNERFEFNIIAAFDNNECLYQNERFFPDYPDVFRYHAGNVGSWSIYFNENSDTFHNIPHMSHRAPEELLCDLISEMSSYLDSFETEIKNIETSYQIPLIDNVVVSNGKTDTNEYDFTFTINGYQGHFSYTLSFIELDIGFFWESTHLKQNDVLFKTYPVTFHNHIIKQCKDIICKHDPVWRIKMMMKPHEHLFLCPLFKKTSDYQMEKKRIDFRYENLY